MRLLVGLSPALAVGCERHAYSMCSKAQWSEIPTDDCVDLALQKFGRVESPEPRVKDNVSLVVRFADGSRYSLALSAKDVHP